MSYHSFESYVWNDTVWSKTRPLVISEAKHIPLFAYTLCANTEPRLLAQCLKELALPFGSNAYIYLGVRVNGKQREL